MRDESLQLFGEQLAVIRTGIEACATLILGCHGDADTAGALNRVQAKYQATAQQLEFEIKALR